MATNGFASTPFVTTGTGSAGASSIFMSRVTLINAATVTAVLLNTPNATSSISFKAVIYDGSHSALLGTGSTVTSVASGYNRFALTGSLSLAAGTYYVGYVCNSACNVSIDASQANSWFVSGGQSVSSPANPLSAGGANSNGLQVGLEFDGSGAAGYGFAPDFTSGVTLSVSNTVATADAARNEAVRSVVTHEAGGGGKFYAEIQVSGTLNAATAVGMFAACTTASSPSNTFKYTEVQPSTGGTTAGTTAASSGITFVSGDVIGIAYDATSGLVWFNKNNGAWGGNGASPNPATGVSGIAVGAGNWPVMVGGVSAVATVFNLRDTADRQSYSAPSGYSSWSSASTGVSATPAAGAVTLTGFAPSPALTVSPAAGLISLTGLAPIVGQAVASGAGSIVYTGYAPAVVFNTVVAPGAGSIIATGFAPTINSNTVVAPSAGSIALTGFTPSLGLAVAPGAGAVNLTGFAPTQAALAASTSIFFRSVF